MKILRIHLYQYRNHENLTFSPEPGKNMIIGKNASGKTNVLEAVAFALTGSMIRQGTEKDLIQYGKEEASIHIDCEEDFRRYEVRVYLYREKPKQIVINGEKISSFREWTKIFPLVIFTPDDLRIAKDSPQYRRRYLNQMLTDTDPIYASALAAYQKSLVHRNALLKEGSGRKHFMEQLNSIDAVLIREGIIIMNRRERISRTIQRMGTVIHNHLSVNQERFSARYLPDIPCNSMERENLIQAFVQAMTDYLEKDIQYKSTGRGPHRDDLELMLDSKPLRIFGSQGQQRTAVLTLKMIEAQYKKQQCSIRPVLLMDDILSELDADRQAYIARMTDDMQILTTGTDNPWSRQQVKQWEIRDGVLSE